MASDFVLILGNGFDISLGLNSSFSDFAYSEFWPFSNTTDGLAGFLTHKIEENPYWSDLEGALLEYASEAGDGSDDPFQINRDKQHFLNLNSYFAAYLLAAQQKKISEYSAALYILECICEKESSVIYSFNYTDLETLVKGCSLCSIDHLPEIHNVHGKLSDFSIILGINDDAVIKPGYEFLYKSFSNYYASNEMQNAMRSAKEVVIFGHSLSQVDNLYFKSYFSEYLTAKQEGNTNVTILTFDSSSAESIINNIAQYTGIDIEIVRKKLNFVLTKDYCTDSSFTDFSRRLKRMESQAGTSSVPTTSETEAERSLIFLQGEGFFKDYDPEKRPKPVSVALKKAADLFSGTSCFLQAPPSEEDLIVCTDLLVFGIDIKQWGNYSIDKFLQNCMNASTNVIRKRIIFVTKDSAGKRDILMALKDCCGGNLSMLYSQIDLSILRLDGSDLYLMENIKDVLAGKPTHRSESIDIEVLAKSFPSSFLPRIAEMQMTLARRYEFTREYQEARKYYLRAADAYLELETSSHLPVKRERISVLIALGELGIKHDEAEDVYKALFNGIDLLPKRDETNYLEFAPLRAKCLLGIARMEARERKYDMSNPRFEESIAIFRKLSEMYPDCFSPSLVEALRWYANLLCRQALDSQEDKLFGRPGEKIHTSSEKEYRDKAEVVYKEMQKILEGLNNNYPTVYAIPLAETLYDIAIAQLEKDSYVAGRNNLLKANSLCKSFLIEKRNNVSKEKRERDREIKRRHILPLLAHIESELGKAESYLMNPEYSESVLLQDINVMSDGYSFLSACNHIKTSIEFYDELAGRDPQAYFLEFYYSLLNLYMLYENYNQKVDSFVLDYFERARAFCMRMKDDEHLALLIKRMAFIYNYYTDDKKARAYYEEAVCITYELWQSDHDSFADIFEECLWDLENYYEEQNEKWRFKFFEGMSQDIQGESYEDEDDEDEDFKDEDDEE